MHDTCSQHEIFVQLLNKMDKRTEDIPSMRVELQNIARAVLGNGKPAVTERLALIEKALDQIEDGEFNSRLTKLEERFEQLLKSLEAVPSTVEEIKKDVEKLTSFYKSMKGFTLKIAAPLFVVTIITGFGMFIKFWFFIQGLSS